MTYNIAFALFYSCNSNDYDADIAKYSSEHGIFGNAIDALYNMLKGWTIFAGVTFAGSERKLKEAEKRYHIVCISSRNTKMNLSLIKLVLRHYST